MTPPPAATSALRTPTESVAASSHPALDRVIVFALGTTLGYGGLAQGAFYPDQLGNVVLLVAVAAVARTLVRGRRVEPFVVVGATGWVLFAAWVMFSGYLHGDVRAAVPMAVLSSCLAAVTWAACALPEQARRVLQFVVLAVAIAVAASGWAGVALHREPLALPSEGLWRAASTLTYANSTAAFLVTSLFLALVVIPPHRRTLSLAVVSVVLLGLLTTMSRAGILALLIGIAVFAAAWSRRAHLLTYWPVLPAVAIAFTGLFPSLPEHSDPDPMLAFAGLGGGALFLVLHCRRRWRRIVVAALGIGVVAIAVLSPAAADAMSRIGSTRFTTTSADRSDLTRVTTEQFRSSPIGGTGPGQLDLEYVNHAGIPVRAEYTHNEYLQIGAETGVVGLALAAAGLAAFAAVAIRRSIPSRTDPLPSATTAGPAALAMVAAFAVHSAFDFLWHVPVLPLLLSVSVVPLLSTADPPPTLTATEDSA